jgi:hypothetical protein
MSFSKCPRIVAVLKDDGGRELVGCAGGGLLRRRELIEFGSAGEEDGDNDIALWVDAGRRITPEKGVDRFRIDRKTVRSNLRCAV